jgi:outer membrane lipoprotein SlyB
MKKLFVVLAVASLGLAACNNSTSSEETRIADSTRTADSLAKVKAIEDSLANAQKAMTPDTLVKDTTKH